LLRTLRNEQRTHGGRGPAILATIVLTLIVVSAGPADAKTFTGSPGADKVKGTTGADMLRGMGGNDKLNGLGGNDSLNGGNGRDHLVGAGGADRLFGGPGNDVLNAVDGRADKAINGGPGRNTCIIDMAVELSLVKGCSTIQGTGTGNGSGPGPGAGLRVFNATGLACDTALPVCVFTISGDGADALLGTVTGGGGVVAAGGSVTVTGPDWTAAGSYGCTGDGFLRVAIGSRSVDVPVDCGI
jgi:hemolysin type calcium-binding protein